jgi:hypothetical protein
VKTAIGVLAKLTQSVSDTTLPPVGQLVLPIVCAEAYAYHAKWIAESPDRYQPFTRTRIIAFAAGVKAPDYAADLRQTNLLRREIVKTFSAFPPSVPCGFTNSGLPIGLQISGAPFAFLAGQFCTTTPAMNIVGC